MGNKVLRYKNRFAKMFKALVSTGKCRDTIFVHFDMLNT